MKSKPTPTPQGQHTPTLEQKRILETLELIQKFFKHGSAVQGFSMLNEETTIQQAVEQSLIFYRRAVNAHEELLECLTILKDCFSDNDGERENFEATISQETLKRVEQAIARASGESR